MVFTIKHSIAWICIAILFATTACSSGIKYNVKGDYKTDGQLMEQALTNTAEELSKNTSVNKYKIIGIELLDTDGAADALKQMASNVLSSTLMKSEITGDKEVLVKFRVPECQVRYFHSGGMTERVASARYHIRLEDKTTNAVVWAGDFSSTATDKVPAEIAKKLMDTRFEQIGQKTEAETANPFIEPLLVVGITGALIYLFSATAQNNG
jgi:hypothetical protein